MGLKKEFNKILLDRVSEYSLTLDEVKAAASCTMDGYQYVLIYYDKNNVLRKDGFTDYDLDIFEDDEGDEVISVDTKGLAIIPYNDYRVEYFIFTLSDYKDYVQKRLPEWAV